MPLFGGLRKVLRGAGRLDSGARWRTYAGLRSMVLGLEPDKLGDPVVSLPHVFGVVVDWSVGDGFATFVALADGTASMYTSSGGGTIGAGGRPGIDAAGAVLLRTVEEHLARFHTAAGTTPPTRGAVTYWALTREGPRTLQHGSDGPPEADPAAQAIGAAFQEYVTQFRLLDQDPSAAT